MSLHDEQWLFLKDVVRLINFADMYGIELTGGELFRTPEQQRIYLDEGKSHTANSNHLRRLAIDFNFFINGELTYDPEKIKPLGTYWETLDPKNRWGGNFPGFQDVPHFERMV
jgi:hypothetical protein